MAAIKELELQVENLANKLQLLAFHYQNLAEGEAHEREKLARRLENALLRFERRLAGGKGGG